MKRCKELGISLALITSVLAGCGSTAANTTTTTGTGETPVANETASTTATTSKEALQVAWGADAETLDVHITSQDYSVPLNIYDRLFEIKLKSDGSTELVNSIVKDYTVSEDGLNYSFTLRDDVKFSDGTSLTASDVAFTLTRMEALDSSVQTDFAACIKGAEAIMEVQGYSYDDLLEGLEVVDDTHLNVTLEYPFAGFLYELATPSCCIYSKAAVEAAGDNYGSDVSTVLGSGAYMVTSWTRESGLTLTANPYYWGTAPDFKDVDISIIPDASTLNMMFQNGEIDVLDCDRLDSTVVAATYKTDAYASKLIVSNRLGTAYLALNQKDEVLSDINVRKAIQKAIDRTSIVNAIFNGDGTTPDGIYPKGLIGYTEANQGWLTYDPVAAEKILTDAGYTKGSDGYYFAMEIADDNNNSESRKMVIQIIAEELKAIGINCTIQSYDHSAWLDLRKSGEMCSYVSTWTADYNDPDNFIYTFFGTESKTLGRSLNYPDKAVMERVTNARAIIDDAQRLAEYAALEKKIVEEDAAWVPLHASSHLFVLSNRVASFEPHWAGYSDFIFANVKKAN